MKRVIIFGCGGIVLLLAIALGVAIWKLPSVIDRGKKLVWETVEEERRIAALEAAWTPPSPSPDGSWFPTVVGEWRLDRSEPVTSIADLRLDRPGHHAAYRSGAGTIEVNVVPVAEGERTEVREKIQNAIGREETTIGNGKNVSVTVTTGANRFTMSRGNRTHIRIGGEDHTRLWWVKGWLFIFRAQGRADSETFPEQFLRAVSPPPADTPLERN